MSPCHDLVSFADGELEPERAAAFREHLRTCESCQAGLVEAMQLSAQLSTLPPRVAPAPEPAAWWRSLWRWLQAQLRGPRPAWVATAPLAVLGLVLAYRIITPPADPAKPHGNAFAAARTRPYLLRLAYGDAAEHRPARDVALGGGGSAVSDRIPFSALSALEQRGDEYGLAIARLWNGDRPADVLKQLSTLEQTPGVRADRAAMAVLTTSNDNAEPVLAELEALRNAGDPAAARAARWNYALLLARLELPLRAAQEFQAIAGEHEAGWGDEAAELAAPQAEHAKAFRAMWKRASDAGEALIKEGTPVPSELVSALPGVLRAYFYNAVRAAPSRDRVLALAPLAIELDRLGDPGQHTLAEYVHRVANLDFTRRAPLAAAYALLLHGKPISDALLTALTSETSTSDIVDIVMGGMVERDAVVAHRAWFQAAAERAGDRWFQVVLARAEADDALARGKWLDAEAVLQNAEKLCSPALAYQCLTIDRRLGKLYADLHRVHESRSVLQRAMHTARSIGEFGRYRSVLWQLADVERFHSATATVRAYASEALLMGDDCENRRLNYRTLAGAALLDVDGQSARRFLAAACGEPDLRVATYFTDVARLDPRPDDLAQLEDMLGKIRASGKLSAPERVLADEIEGRLVIEHDRAAGVPLLEKAIAAADKMIAAADRATGEVIADKARAAAYTALAFDAARAGDHTAAFGLIARDLGLSAPGACAVGMVAEDERAVVVVRGGDGRDRGFYDHQRKPSAGALAVPDPLARSLAGCAHVGVMAPAALQGQPRVLPADLAWSYTAGVRDRFTAPSKPATAPRPLIVTNVIAPEYLELPPLSPQLPDTATATTLSGAAATPVRVLSAMADASEIQFHTHALMDVGVSDASHLVLSPELPGAPYALTAEAIRAVKLRGHPVVVLAACHSAQGAHYQHEPWSLPDAFLAVGARAVFAAATDIPDVESGRFFARVLAEVRKGAEPAAALRDQRKATLQTNPSSWVADVLLFE